MINVLDYCTGLGTGFAVPEGVGNMIHLIVLLIQVAVPIMLIIWGMIDFAKATIGGDEDSIKKGQKVFMKRFIAAIIVFLIVTITQLVITAVGSVGGEGNSANSAWSCAKEIISGRS